MIKLNMIKLSLLNMIKLSFICKSTNVMPNDFVTCLTRIRFNILNQSYI